ncbi:hypothetical protein D922_02418 [Enterococcus faecalis 06-MB-DW-09]|nr:hypothetical protein D922_02418 [Enterococcus faecalis 06-MB-DW-09]
MKDKTTLTLSEILLAFYQIGLAMKYGKSHLIGQGATNMDEDELEEYWEFEDLDLFSLAR